MQPAMNYDDYCMSTSLNKLKCFQDITVEENKPVEYLFAYNGTATRCMIIKQPLVKRELEMSPSIQE